MPQYYCNVNDAFIGSGGDGSYATPYDISQIDNFLRGDVAGGNTLADGDTVSFKGRFTLAGVNTTFTKIVKNVTLNSYDDGFSEYSITAGGFTDISVVAGKTVVFQDFIFDIIRIQSNAAAAGTGVTITFKNCSILAGVTISPATNPSTQTINFYGCTIIPYLSVTHFVANTTVTVNGKDTTFMPSTWSSGVTGIIVYTHTLASHTTTTDIRRCHFYLPSFSYKNEDSVAAGTATTTGEEDCFFGVVYEKSYIQSAAAGGHSAVDLDDITYNDYGLPLLAESEPDWTTFDYGTGYDTNARYGYGAFYFNETTTTFRTLRLAIEPSQGVGWCEISGDAWSQPQVNYGIINFIDAQNQYRNIVLDSSDGYFYEEGTYDRAAQVRLPARDKETGSSGTEIAWEWHERGIDLSPEMEDAKIEHTVSHYYLEPKYPTDKGSSGYDSNGFRDNQQIDLEVFADGNVETLDAETNDIPKDGDIVFSGYKVEDRQLQFVLKGAAGEITVKGRRHDFVSKPKTGSRSERTMADMTSQATLASPAFWMVRGNSYGPLREQVGQTTLTATGSTITGADGRSDSGYNLTANLTLTNAAQATDYTIVLFCSSAVTVTAGALTQVGATFNTTWGLWYVQGGDGCAASQVVTIGDIFDVRIYSSQLTAADMLALYNDVRYNSGRGYLPIF